MDVLIVLHIHFLRAALTYYDPNIPMNLVGLIISAAGVLASVYSKEKKCWLTAVNFTCMIIMVVALVFSCLRTRPPTIYDLSYESIQDTNEGPETDMCSYRITIMTNLTVTKVQLDGNERKLAEISQYRSSTDGRVFTTIVDLDPAYSEYRITAYVVLRDVEIDTRDEATKSVVITLREEITDEPKPSESPVIHPASAPSAAPAPPSTHTPASAPVPTSTPASAPAPTPRPPSWSDWSDWSTNQPND